MGNRLTKLYKENKLPASDVSDLLQAADEAGLEFANPIPKKRKFEPGKATELGEVPEPEEGCRDRMLQEAWTDSYERTILGKICIGQRFL